MRIKSVAPAMLSAMLTLSTVSISQAGEIPTNFLLQSGSESLAISNETDRVYPGWKALSTGLYVVATVEALLAVALFVGFVADPGESHGVFFLAIGVLGLKSAAMFSAAGYLSDFQPNSGQVTWEPGTDWAANPAKLIIPANCRQ